MKNKASDKLIYKIQNEKFTIHVNNGVNNILLKKIENLKSDNKIFFVYDSNIDNKIILNLIKFLKKTGNIILTKRLKGNKSNKNKNQLFEIIDKLIKEKFTKKSILISMGGGVIGDLSALAASLYLRGLIYFHIPTTMTSIVDSCIGGKTGINYNNVINSVGNYYHAKGIFIDYQIIKNLPQREYTAGLAEILKCCIINSGMDLNFLIKNKNNIIQRDISILKKLILFALKTKIKFFKDDVFENKNRLVLNFGHTFAHAIEMAMVKNGKEVFRHGEAVGLGMLCELRIAGKNNLAKKLLEQYGGLDTNDLQNYFNYDEDEENEPQILKQSAYIDLENIEKFIEQNKHNFNALSMNIESANSKFDELITTLQYLKKN